MRDVRVAADIAGARFKGDHRFAGTDIGQVEDYEIFGSAIGVPAASGHSMYGVFSDANGNTILVAQESSQTWTALRDKGLPGSNPIIFQIPRLFGDGHGEVDALTLAGITAELEGRTSWKDISELAQLNADSITRVGLKETFNDAQTLLEALERIGHKYDATVVVLLSGSPITFGSIVKPFAKLIISAASSALAMVGIPPDISSLLLSLVDSAFNGDPISVDSLVKAAQIITPASLRGYLDDGIKLVSNIQSGNYHDAAAVLGIDPGPELRKLIANLEQGDLVQTIIKSAKQYTPLVGTVTNALNADVMHKFFSNVTTKTISNAIIDAGSTTGVTHMLHLYSSLTDSTTIGAITGADGVVESVMKNTRDITSPEILRGFANLLNGRAIGVDTFDALLLKGLKSKANALAIEGKRLVMPIAIPYEKRITMAQNIASDVGVAVVAGEGKIVSHYGGFS